jgi:uncharacterized protein YcbX
VALAGGRLAPTGCRLAVACETTRGTVGPRVGRRCVFGLSQNPLVRPRCGWSHPRPKGDVRTRRGPSLTGVHLEGVWRYPIKSMGAEPLAEAQVTVDGVAGDRVVHAAGDHGVVTGRTRHGLLTLAVQTAPDGTPMIDGQPWNSPAARDRVRAAAGPGVHLASYRGPERFDIANLLVATDGAVTALGVDVRRLRPNLLIGGVAADQEATWPGRGLAIGDAVIGVHSLRDRCIVTTIDPNSGVQDVNVLRRIRQEFEGKLALNCWTITPGTVRVGDTVRVVDTDAVPGHLGGWIVGAPYRLAG